MSTAAARRAGIRSFFTTTFPAVHAARSAIPFSASFPGTSPSLRRRDGPAGTALIDGFPGSAHARIVPGCQLLEPEHVARLPGAAWDAGSAAALRIPHRPGARETPSEGVVNLTAVDAVERCPAVRPRGRGYRRAGEGRTAIQDLDSCHPVKGGWPRLPGGLCWGSSDRAPVHDRATCADLVFKGRRSDLEIPPWPRLK